jgi:nitrous oxidase accessory protein NosD
LPIVILVIGSVTFGTGTDTDSEKLVAELENPDISARNQQILPIEGNGEPTNFNTASIGLDTVIIRDAPNTIIEGQQFIGKNLTLINSPNSIIRNNVFQNISSSTVVHAIRLENSSNSIIEGNQIFNISSSASNSPAVVGIEIVQSSDVIIRDNHIQNLYGTSPSKYGIYGIFLTEVTRIEIVGNLFEKLSSNEVSYGIYARGSSEIAVINNEIISLSAISVPGRAFSIGMWFDLGSSQVIIQGNRIEDLWSHSYDVHDLSSGIIFFHSTDVIIENNTILALSAIGNGRNEMIPVLLIDTVTDFSFDFGKTLNIFFTSEDPERDMYRLYHNGNESLVGPWSYTDWERANRVELPVDTLGLGRHIFTILLENSAGAPSARLETIIVTIGDSLFPEIRGPEDMFVEYSLNPLELVWRAVDNNPHNFTLDHNGNDVENGMWNSLDPIVHFPVLGIGIHYFTLSVFDRSGNMANDTVIITIADNTAPEVPMLEDVKLESGTGGNNLTWIFMDLNPNFFRIFLNGTEELNGTWVNDDIIIFNLDGLWNGYYEVQLEVDDLYGNTFIDIIEVIVFDSLSPMVIGPFQVFFVEGETGHSILWTVLDENPFNYTIFENGISKTSGFWGQSQTLTLLLDGLSSGQYNITLVLYDTTANMASHSVLVIVYPEGLLTGTQTGDNDTVKIFGDIDPTITASAGIVIAITSGAYVLIRRR